jgi:glutamate--cysteine ligase
MKTRKTNPDIAEFIIESITSNESEIHAWLKQRETECSSIPIYSSVDIRHTHYKFSVIDTNIYPAGFNNLAERSITKGKHEFVKAIKKRCPHCKRILLVTERSTRNLWYLENIAVLFTLLHENGFEVTIGTFFTKTDPIEKMVLKSSSGIFLHFHDIGTLYKKRDLNTEFDLILLNNDLSNGIPSPLKHISIPVHPPLYAGWWHRSKTRHFIILNALLAEFAALLEIDPWLISCLFSPIESFDMLSTEDHKNVVTAAEEFYEQIEQKHRLYGIQSKPFIFIKADSGTSGRGVIPIEHPKDILEFSNKMKHDLCKGKQSRKITKFLLQEGLESIDTYQSNTCEPVIYSINNHPIGGFFRINPKKNPRENLSSPNSYFEPLSVSMLGRDSRKISIAHSHYDLYSLLARLAGIAVSREIIELESSK